MAEVWKSKPTRVLQDWIDQCIESTQLTHWERDFVESVGEQLERRGTLSERQQEILERIYAEKTK